MNEKRQYKTRTPGEPVSEQHMPPQAPEAPETPAETPEPELSPEMLAIVDAAVKRRLRAAEAARNAPRRNNENLPDVSEVDPDKISRAVLTKQGWIVPNEQAKKQRQVL